MSDLDALLDVNRAAVDDLMTAAEQCEAVWTIPREPGKWSPSQIVEHVARVPLFLSSCAALIKPGGALIMSTLNRTAKSFLMAIVGAEYFLRWLPRGTHQWGKFIRPSELTEGVEATGLSVANLTGATYNPLNDDWRLSRDMAVNYMLYAEKEAR